MTFLGLPELRITVSAIAQRLDALNIDYAIMGGAATCLLDKYSTRRTKDVDIVIHVDHRMITADNLTTQLLKSFPSDFEGISQYGHIIPAYKLRRSDGAVLSVELEVFDYQSWPQRPQYNIQAATRRTMTINGQAREGNAKEVTDILDLTSMIPLVEPGKAELDFNHSEELQIALANLLKKRQNLVGPLKKIVKCNAVFHN